MWSAPNKQHQPRGTAESTIVKSGVCQFMSLPQLGTNLRIMCMIGQRRMRPSATAMAACLALALSLVATAKAFVLPARAMNQAQTGLMSSSCSSSGGSLGGDSAAAGLPRRSLSRRGGRMREVVGVIRGGNSGPAGPLSASSLDAVASEMRDVLGGNEGVLNEEQRAMATTLVVLGQVQQ